LIRRIKFCRDIGDKKYLLRLYAHHLRNLSIAFRFAFLPNLRIEVTVDKPCEISDLGVSEEELLGQHTTGRENTDLQTAISPTLKRRRHIREDLRLQRSIFVTLPPDLPLQ